MNPIYTMERNPRVFTAASRAAGEYWTPPPLSCFIHKGHLCNHGRKTETIWKDHKIILYDLYITQHLDMTFTNTRNIFDKFLHDRVLGSPLSIHDILKAAETGAASLLTRSIPIERPFLWHQQRPEKYSRVRSSASSFHFPSRNCGSALKQRLECQCLRQLCSLQAPDISPHPNSVSNTCYNIKRNPSCYEQWSEKNYRPACRSWSNHHTRYLSLKHHGTWDRGITTSHFHGGQYRHYW